MQVRLFAKKIITGITTASMMLGLVGGICLTGSVEVKAENPIVQHIFAPDPAPMVYNDKVYLYTTHDEDVTVGGFYTMLNWHCFSTEDMVNWTSHGQILSLDDFSWAEDRAWAAQCVERDGTFYLYVPIHKKNGGVCIGVATSDKPEGPFKAAIETPLVDEGDWNDIDPTVYIDDDGQAYLYFGNPELRYVKLNEDMISYDKSLGVQKMDMTAEAFGPTSSSEKSCSYAEGPWFYKRNGLYYMVYPAFGDGGSENISYSTSKSPTGPWEFGGIILSPNNCYTIHPGVCDFKGHSYLFYHNNMLDKTSSFHRSVCLEEFKYNDDGSIDPVDQTLAGVKSVANLNPYKRVEAETICWERGVDVENREDGGCNLFNIHNNNFVKIKDVDFGEGGPIGVSVNAACAGVDAEGTVEFRIDCDEDLTSESSNEKELFAEGFDIHNTDIDYGDIFATVDISSTGGENTFKDFEGKITQKITGVHDVFVCFASKSGKEDNELFKLDYWQFKEEPKPEPSPQASTAPATVTNTPPQPTAVVSVSQASPSPVVSTGTTAGVKVAKVKGISVKRKGAGKVYVSWKKASGAKKYELLYTTDKKFKKGIKKITLKKTSATIKKLKKGKTYYFKARGFAGKVYGGYSAVKNTKV